MTASPDIKQFSVLLAIVLLAISPTAYAQGNKSPGVKAKLACATIHKSLGKLAYRSSKTGGYEEIQLNVNHLSQAIRITPEANGRVYFYDPANLPEKDKPVAPVASFKPPLAGTGEVLVLLLPSSAKKKTVYGCKTIAANQDFNFGSSCLINLTRKDVYFLKNKRKPVGKLARGKSSVFKPGGANPQAGIEMFTPHAKSQRITKFYSATWSFSPKVRELCLVYQIPGKKWPTTKVISDMKRDPIAVNP